MNKTSRGINKASEVEPLKNPKDIQKIKQYLLGKENKRDYCLFVVGINVGLRASDLLQLKVKDVEKQRSVRIIEKKTGKIREFELNKSARDAITLYLNSLDTYNQDDYLFLSRKGANQHITVQHAHHLIKSTCKDLKIKGNYGTHTLRKTFGYHVYSNNIAEHPDILNTLQKMFNHSSSAVTLRYVGITKEVITNIYRGLNL